MDRELKLNFKEGQFEKLTKRLREEPKSIVLLSKLAETCNLTGQYEKAIESCKIILEGDKKYKPAYDNLFFAYDQLEDFDNVLKVLKDCLESFHLIKHPELQKHSYSLWVSRYYKKKDKGLPFYVRDLPFGKPLDIIDINFSTAFHFSKIGWSERSSEVLNLMLEFYPKDIDILNALAYSYANKRQYSEAEETIKKALALNKKNYKTHSILGGIYRKTGKYKEAEQEYIQLIQNLNQFDFPLDNMLEIQTKVTEQNAFDIIRLLQTYLELGFLYNDTGEYDQAINQFLKVRTFFKNAQLFSLNQNPTLTLAYHGLGIAYRALGYDKMALKSFKKAAVNDRDNEDVLASLGELYFEMNKYKHAIKTLQHVIEIKPNDHLIWHLLSKAHYQKGEIAFALETNAKCLDLTPNFEPALKFQEKLSQHRKKKG